MSEIAPAGFNLTKRDVAILDALTQRVRALTLDQVATHWFGATTSPRKNARRRLRALEAAELVEIFSMAARPIPDLPLPIVAWKPGDNVPEFEKVSYRLVARWRLPAVETVLVIASRQAGIWLGGYGGRRPRRSETSHDIAMGALYLRWLSGASSESGTWISEARLTKMGFGDHRMLPDAVVEFDKHRKAIEFGGAYKAEKLRMFHKFCADEDLPYELW